MGDTHVYLIRPVATTPSSEPDEQHNLHRNSTASLPQKKIITWMHGHYGMAFEQCIINNATDDWCKHLWECVHVIVIVNSVYPKRKWEQERNGVRELGRFFPGDNKKNSHGVIANEILNSPCPFFNRYTIRKTCLTCLAERWCVKCKICFRFGHLVSRMIDSLLFLNGDLCLMCVCNLSLIHIWRCRRRG